MSKGNRDHIKFLESFSSENIVGLFSRYKGSAKEISESMGCLYAFRKLNLDSSKTIVLVVGDGASPRTGAIISYFTKASVISVDPNINLDHWQDHCGKQGGMGYPVKRLLVYKDKIEDLLFDCWHRHCVIILPHSHADMRKIFVENYSSVSVISLPCCVPIPSTYARIPHMTYEDADITSDKRTFHIWSPSDELDQAIENNKKSFLKDRTVNKILVL